MLNDQYTFSPANLLVGMSWYPAVVKQDNGDGTFQGYLNLENASPVEKLAALTDFKYYAAKNLIGI